MMSVTHGQRAPAVPRHASIRHATVTPAELRYSGQRRGLSETVGR